MYCLIVLQAKILKVGYWQGNALSLKALDQGPSLPLPSFWQLQSLESLCIIPVSASVVMWYFPCVCIHV